MKIYFAHPITDYGTERQRTAIAALRAFRVTVEVENPDQPHHQAGYARHGMAYFKPIVESCWSLAFMRFPNGAIGAGMGKEIQWAANDGKILYEVFDGRVYPTHYAPTPILTVDETRALIAKYRSGA